MSETESHPQRNCPISGKPMEIVVRDGVTIDVSPEYGMWLDKTELFLLTEKERYDQSVISSWFSFLKREVYPPVDRDRVLKCPICGEPMQLVEHHEVFIDRCEKHGVWLDNGELEAILNNLKADPFYLRGVALRLNTMQL